MKLIIVESPNKIKKIKAYAGPEYEVAASVGHIRDLITDKQTGSIGVDRQNNHALIYGISPDKKEVVANLRSKAKAAGAGNVLLATDPDREGEAIAFHLCEVLNLDPRTTKRITFQEITEKAVKAAIANPRTIDLPLVHAQEGRRAVDRLVGFTVSPVLSRKIAQGLSAGRVQSVAVRLIVERERQIQGHSSSEFTLPVTATVQTPQWEQFRARRTNATLATIEQAQAYLQQVGQQLSLVVTGVEKKPVQRQPQPAFSTSTLQQEGVKKLKFTVQQVTDVAQKLFEGGHVTYIRTDSVNLGQEATEQARTYISAQFGADQFQARQTKNKDGAQEAHEAIRPTHWENPSAGDTEAEQALYRLIYTRAVASQMIAASYDQTTITLAPPTDPEDTYSSSTRILTQPGYLAAYQEAEDEADGDGDQEQQDEATLSHPIEEGELVQLLKLEARQSFARPAKRYNEATIVADLEKRGIGRPSTYASILSRIFERQYMTTGNVAGQKLTAQLLTWEAGQVKVSQKSETLGADKGKLLPTATGTTVTEFLETNFPRIMDYKFTAGCEAMFDKIAQGTMTYQQFVPAFDKSLLEAVAQADKLTPDRPELQKRLVGQFEGQEMLIGIGKNGPYILHAEKYYNIAEGVSHATLTESQAQAIITERRKSAPREVGNYQGQPVIVGQSAKGTYMKWKEQYYQVPEGIPSTSVTLDEAARYITQAQAQQQANTLAAVGKYTIGKNEWGLFVSDGVVKAKFKPGVTEDEARATTAEECAEMIKRYKAWKKKNSGKK